MGESKTVRKLEYINDIRRFQTSDPAHADLLNEMLDALVNNDNFLKNELGGLSFIKCTQAEYDALGAGRPEDTIYIIVG